MLEVVVDDMDFGRWMRNWGVNAVFFIQAVILATAIFNSKDLMNAEIAWN